MNIKNCLLCVLGSFTLVTGAYAVDTLQINSVTGTWNNVQGGTNLTGAGTNQIFWGSTDPDFRSGYSFLGNAPPLFFPVVGQVFDLGTFTHFNQPIPLNSSITGASLTTAVNMTINGVTKNLNFVFDFSHNETPNVPGTCPAGSGSICDDIVSFNNNVAQSSTFDINGQQFTIQLVGFLKNNQLVSQFLTQEQLTNNAILEAVITTTGVSVPEPSTYLLLGAALGVAVLLKKRASAKNSTHLK